MENNNYTFIDLFAGCGGLSLGLMQAGFTCKWAIEIDPNASETYRFNLGDHLITDDVRNIETKDLPQVDILVGGFPCQPFSISGLQGGFDGKDGDLFYQCVRFINALSPKIFMLENVGGFATLKKGYYLKTAIEILSNLGYYVSWKVLDCSDFSIPQTRKRCIIMGNKIGVDNLYPVPTYKKVSVKEAIDDIWQNPNDFENNEPMKHTPRIVERFSYVKQGETASDAMKRHPELGTAKITKQCYRRMIENDPAPTIVANFVTTTIHYSQNRNLTAREAARIQTFPDTFIFKGYKTRMSWQKELSQFEQIGNAVPPRLAELMGECMFKMLKGEAPKINPHKLEKPKQLTLDLDFEEIEPKKEKQARGKTHSNRGRSSKFANIYEQIENLNCGKTIDLSNQEDDFFIFLAGAMRRRNIEYALSDNKIFTKIK